MELRCPFCDSPLPANLPASGAAECPFCRAKVDLAAAWALQQGGADAAVGSRGLELDLGGVTDEPGSGKATEAYIRPEALATTAYTREEVPPDLTVERVGSYSLRGTDNPNARESVFPGGAGRPAARKPAAAQQPAQGAKKTPSKPVPRPPGTARMKSEFVQPPPPRQEPGRPAAGGGGGRPPGSPVKPPVPPVAPAQPARGHAAAAAADAFASLFTSPVSPVTGFTGVRTADEASAPRAAPAADPLAAWGGSPAFGGGAGRGDASPRASGGPSAVSVPAGGFGDFDLPSEFDLGAAPVASATPSAMEPFGQPAAGAPPGRPAAPDVGSPFDNLSGAVPSAEAPAPDGPGKAAQAPSADGDPFGALDFSFDDLAPGTLPGAGGATNPGVTGRVQGRPPGSGLGAIDLDDVLSEDAGTDVVMPWTSARPKQTVQIGAAPEIPEPGHSLASGFAPGPGYGPGSGFGSQPAGAAPGHGADPTADLDLDGIADSWGRAGRQAGAGGGGEDLAGLTLDYGVTEGGLGLDLGGAQGASPSLGVETPAAAPPPVAIKTKAARARGLGLTGAPKVALLAVLLLGLVGVILGQTDYGYFGMNLLSGGAERPTARKALPPPGATSGIARDTKESFLEEVERLERLAKGEEKNAQHRADLLEVLLRFRERYPALFSVGSKLDMRLKELQRGTQMSGQKADMVRVMDLVTSGKYDEARVLLDGMVALSAQDADVLYFYGKVALGQNKPDEALRYFELALLKNPGSITAKYFLAMTHVARRDVARAKATLEEILSREANHLPSKLAMAELAFDGRDYETAARLAGEIVAKARSGSDSG
ncbi:MAG: tetratricopeptide repeat protein, partial [Deltaproteobacteria bacterium]|nr:tetratricopeptide repeat protein [Deltaproteobacteria bacterium]